MFYAAARFDAHDSSITQSRGNRTKVTKDRAGIPDARPLMDVAPVTALADLGALASTTVWMNKHLLTCCDTSPLRLENGCDEWAGRPQSLRGDLVLHLAVRIKEVTQSWRATKAFAPTRQATDDVVGAGSGPHPWRWPPNSKGGQVGEARQPFLFFGYQPHSRSRQRWKSCPPRLMPLP